jgi:alkaline phosphatase
VADGIDVILGGGSSYFTPKEAGGLRNDKRDLVAELKTARYGFAANKAEFDKLPVDGTTRIAGLFTKSHMAYDLDRDATKEPSLAEMTSKSIDALVARRKKGFFLMVEGGRIDHALHATNARRALQDTVAFDDAVKVALDKMKRVDPDLKNTLIVVTADHDHTLQMNGYAQRTGKTEAGKPGVLGLVKNYVDGASSKDVDGNPYTILGFGNGPRRLATRGAIDSTALESADYLQEAVVPLATETHGGGDVFLGAQGQGAENFSGSLTNNEVFGLIRKATGL